MNLKPVAGVKTLDKKDEDLGASNHQNKHTQIHTNEQQFNKALLLTFSQTQKLTKARFKRGISHVPNPI